MIPGNYSKNVNAFNVLLKKYPSETGDHESFINHPSSTRSGIIYHPSNTRNGIYLLLDSMHLPKFKKSMQLKRIYLPCIEIGCIYPLLVWKVATSPRNYFMIITDKFVIIQRG